MVARFVVCQVRIWRCERDWACINFTGSNFSLLSETLPLFLLYSMCGNFHFFFGPVGINQGLYGIYLFLLLLFLLAMFLGVVWSFFFLIGGLEWRESITKRWEIAQFLNIMKKKRKEERRKEEDGKEDYIVCTCMC